MATFAPAESVGLYRGLELRRSKRIHRPIRLMILGRDLEGQPYREKMSTVSLSLHGCCYQSWHNSRIGAEVELQLAEGSVNRPSLLRASVRYVRPPMSHSELFQIGVEFDAPQREWLIVQEETIVGPAPHMSLALNPQRLEEFRRQLELQMRLAICEVEQRLSCSLTALEAETHTACDARRRAFENEVAQAAERAVHQFRSGIKAYLSASLVAAIEAVDKHAKTALTVLIKGPA